MLKYKLRVTNDDIVQREIDLREKYTSPNLDFVSGVTDTSSLHYTSDTVSSYNRIDEIGDTLTVEREDVTREGFILIKGKAYDVISDVSLPYGLNGDNFTYVNANGRYYYLASDGSYTFDDWIVCTSETDSEYMYATKKLLNQASNSKINLDTVYWIEDGIVNIDGEKYIFDKNVGDGGGLFYTEGGKLLEPSEICECTNIVYCPFKDVKKYEKVSKLKFTKEPYKNVDLKAVRCAEYYYFAEYNGVMCYVEKVYENVGDNVYYKYVCNVPENLVISDGDPNVYVQYPLYSYSDGSTVRQYITTSGSTSYQRVWVDDINDLMTLAPYVDLSTTLITPSSSIGDGIELEVNSMLMDSIGGPLVSAYMVYGSNEKGVSVGSNVVLSINDDVTHLEVYNLSSYNGQDDGDFVIYDGRRYDVQPNLFDAIVMGNGYEYQIEYPNGKVNGVDALVDIDGEKVPMKIRIAGGSSFLYRYGNVVTDTHKSKSTFYQITQYDGVIIDDYAYKVYNDGSVVTRYAEIDIPHKMLFNVVDMNGSSLAVLEPELIEVGVNDEFIESYKKFAVSEAVSKQDNLTMQVPNYIFGSERIEPYTAFMYNDSPKSSDNGYPLLSNLSIYYPNAFIKFPFSLDTSLRTDQLQDDLVKTQFFDSQRDAAINRIVDMEKDVYTPKYLVGNSYSASSSNFKPIREIDVNLHFRTRDLDTWKINEDDEDASNWFVTDFYPYASYTTSTYLNKLQEMSDLVGLMNITNNDVYYQKSLISKSFLRFSFYDSINPQTQSLLYTSTVFMDENKLYKKYIDNSRKGMQTYENVARYDTELIDLPKISVLGERVGVGNNNNRKILFDNDDVRLSSRFIIKNKYESLNSSEGFYLYIFKEYSENLHPKPIYMKVEFNHAGIGKTIPFIIPMSWEKKSGSKVFTPKSILKLSSTADTKTLKEGVPLSRVYAQSYIPLYAVFDYNNNEYVYTFDKRYVTVGNDGVAKLNLFELKVKNEENDSGTTLYDYTSIIDSKF